MLSFSFQFIFGLLGLYFGAEWLIKGSVSIAKFLRISPVIIGLTIVGYGTSLPELIVSMQAARIGQGDVALGNVIGSNIANIGLIAGISLLIYPISIAPQLIKKDIPVMVLITIIFYFVIMFSDQMMTRTIGVLFCIILVVYTIWLIFVAKKSVDQELQAEFMQEMPKTIPSLIVDIILILIGLVLLSVGGHFLLKGVVGFGRILQVSEAIIGLSIVAISTSLPELTTSIVAAIRKHGDIAIANVIGSNIYNILGVIGLSSALFPFRFNDIQPIDSATMLIFAFLFTLIILIKHRLTRWNGALFLFLYAVYLIYRV